MVCELSDLGLIKIRGNDAKKFLQGQLTCNMDTVSAQASLGAHCNPQGRVISLFYVFQFQDAYFLLMPRSMITITITALKKYAIFFKVEIMDVSDEWHVSGIQNLDMKRIHLQNLICIPFPHSRYMIAGTHEPMKQFQKEWIKQTEVVSQDYWNYLRICDGLPELHPETSSKFLPHDLNLHQIHAISFDKGCYTGQEVIARMHYRGKLKNHLYKAKVTSDTCPVPGNDVYSLQGMEWKAAGMVVDAAREVYDGHYHFLMIANEPNGLFLIKDKNSVIIL